MTQSAQPGPGATDPAKTMGIVGLILAIFCAVVGLVVSIIAFVKSRNAGFTNIPALIGIVIGILACLGWGWGGATINSQVNR